MIRKVGSGFGGDGDDGDSNALRAGRTFELRYRGGSKWYPGKIAYDNRNGTYDIDYDDGEKERSVESNLIRMLGGGSGSGRRGGISEEPREGDKIEARYRGGSKWYPGKRA